MSAHAAPVALLGVFAGLCLCCAGALGTRDHRIAACTAAMAAVFLTLGLATWSVT